MDTLNLKRRGRPTKEKPMTDAERYQRVKAKQQSLGMPSHGVLKAMGFTALTDCWNGLPVGARDKIEARIRELASEGGYDADRVIAEVRHRAG